MHSYIVISHTLSVIYLFRDVSSQFLPGAFPVGPPMARMPMASIMQMPLGAPAPSVLQQLKLPVVIMPYKKTNEKKSEKKSEKKPKSKKARRNYRAISSSSETSSSCESNESDDSSKHFEFRANKRVKLKKNGRRQVLTPVVSYMSKDGHVIYQKKIRKDKARDLLQLGEKDTVTKSNEIIESDDEVSSSRSHGTRRSRSTRHQH